ncbi:hypothetical protein DL96DRAFT_1627341 [Flagelloscypha sp. PMI_526]|nr:hypothetical protein DL96DRAFT_1627341 [Flagelloscypha sp. PMI_526]
MDVTFMSPSIRRLQELTDEYFDATVECMCRGTENDTSHLAAAGWDASLCALSHQLNLRLALIGGQIYIAENPTKSDIGPSVCGVAVWYPPGRSSVLTPDVIGDCMQELGSRLNPDKRRWWTDEYIAGLGELYRSSFGEEDEPHYRQWHLQTIIVDIDGNSRPEIIKSLLEPLFASRGEATMCVEVEKKDDMSFYTNMGFKCAGEHHFRSDYGSFTMCAMTFRGST